MKIRLYHRTGYHRILEYVDERCWMDLTTQIPDTAPYPEIFHLDDSEKPRIFHLDDSEKFIHTCDLFGSYSLITEKGTLIFNIGITTFEIKVPMLFPFMVRKRIEGDKGSPVRVRTINSALGKYFCFYDDKDAAHSSRIKIRRDLTMTFFNPSYDKMYLISHPEEVLYVKPGEFL